MVDGGLSPRDPVRRSPLQHLLEREGARFSELAGGAVVMDFGRDAVDEMEQARRLALADLTPLPRIGFKGAGTLAWLRDQGMEIGEQNNRAWAQRDGTVAVRLADNEVLILGDLAASGGRCTQLERRSFFDANSRCYPVPRRDSHAWLLVSGVQAASTLAKLCAVDLRTAKFAETTVAQTFVAKLPGIVIRRDLNDVPAFHLLFDNPSAEYLWRCLRQAMGAEGGRPVGLAAMRALERGATEFS